MQPSFSSHHPPVGPGPRDVVVVCDSGSVTLQVPSPSLPASPMRIACRSYGEAVLCGRQIARERNVDFWAIERDVISLLVRRNDDR